MAREKKSSAKRRDWTPSFLKHRTLMAAEAVLVVGLLKGLMETWVKAADLPNWGKVVFIMAGTLGLLGGLYWVIESITTAGVARTHAMLSGFSLPHLSVHGLVFVVLFFLYSVQQRIPLW